MIGGMSANRGAALEVPEPSLWIATDTLERWGLASRELGGVGPGGIVSDLAGPCGIVSDLDPLGRHWLRSVSEPEGSDTGTVLAELELLLGDGTRRVSELPLPREPLLAAIAGASDRDPDVWLGGLGAGPVPRWVGVPAYAPVYRALRSLAHASTLLYDDRRGRPEGAPVRDWWVAQEAVQKGACALAAIGERHMRRAIPVAVDPRLVVEAPAFDVAEEVGLYAGAVDLSEGPLFLDTSGPRGLGAPLWLGGRRELETRFMLLGGLAWPERDGVSVMPFGYVSDRPRRALARSPAFYGRVLYGLRGAVLPLSAGERVTLYEERFEMRTSVFALSPCTGVFLRESEDGGELARRVHAFIDAGDPGELHIAATAFGEKISGSEDPVARDPVATTVGLTQLAFEILRLIKVLDIDEVEFTEAPLSRRAQRHAERERRPIATSAKAAAWLTPAKVKAQICDGFLV